MSPNQLAPAAVIAALTALATADIAPAACPGPPWNAWPSGTQQPRCSITMNPCTISPDNCPSVPAAIGGPQSCRQRGTYDQQYVGQWCSSSSSFLELWNGLHMEASDWDEGFGLALQQGSWGPLCGVDDHLTRLLNAAHLVRRVEEHAKPFGFHRWIHDPDDDLGPADVFPSGKLRGAWWGFTKNHEPDEWVPSCDNEGAVATNVTGVDDYVELHRTGAYRTSAINRAGTIIHETVHEDVSHIDALAALLGSPCQSSCDDRFGRYNATTMQIFFLYDAATTYQLGEVNAQPVRIGVPFQKSGTRWCKYNPIFSTWERNQALRRANRKFDKKFVFGPVQGLGKIADAAEADAWTRAEWTCDTCDVTEWIFDPSECNQTACNEFLAAGNDAINAANAAACANYNVEVALGGNSLEAIALANANLNAALQPCHAPQQLSAVDYCNARKAAATHVVEIDPCGWLEGIYVPGFSKSICIQQFCHEQFQADFAADGASQWSPAGDPHGCLAAICAPDGEKCSDDLSPAECRQLFIAAHGHPAFYAESCTIDGCRRLRAQCLSAKLVANPNAWEFPAPVPAECHAIYDACKQAEQASMTTYLSLKDLEASRIPDTGPVERIVNPGLKVQSAVAEYRELVASGAGEDELEGIRRFLFSQPEMLRALFELAPGRFVALFGRTGFEEFIGPQILAVTPEPITPSDLLPEGQAALAELEALIESVPPEELISPFGTLLSQRDGR